MSDDDLDQQRLLAFLRAIGADGSARVVDQVATVLQLAPSEFMLLPLVNETIDRQAVFDRVHSAAPCSRTARVEAAAQGLVLAAQGAWEAPLLPLLLFCTQWTEQRARDAAAVVDGRGVELPPRARVWLDTICRKSVVRN